MGLVAFSMEQLRFWGVSYPSFLETNLRTYVRHPVHGPGVWFFSLDASRYVPCLTARSWFKLPYCHATMELRPASFAKGIRDNSKRLPPVFESPADNFEYELTMDPGSSNACSEVGTFDFWALERYQLFSADRSGRLFSGRVWHEPYSVSAPQMGSFQFHSSDPRFVGLNFTHFRFCQEVSVLSYAPTLC